MVWTHAERIHRCSNGGHTEGRCDRRGCSVQGDTETELGLADGRFEYLWAHTNQCLLKPTFIFSLYCFSVEHLLHLQHRRLHLRLETDWSRSCLVTAKTLLICAIYVSSGGFLGHVRRHTSTVVAICVCVSPLCSSSLLQEQQVIKKTWQLRSRALFLVLDLLKTAKALLQGISKCQFY